MFPSFSSALKDHCHPQNNLLANHTKNFKTKISIAHSAHSDPKPNIKTCKSLVKKKYLQSFYMIDEKLNKKFLSKKSSSQF